MPLPHEPPPVPTRVALFFALRRRVGFLAYNRLGCLQLLLPERKAKGGEGRGGGGGDKSGCDSRASAAASAKTRAAA